MAMFRGFVGGFAALAGGALFSQFPGFYQAYLQRLGGRLDQARLQIARIEEAARAEGYSLADYIAYFRDHALSEERRQGEIMIAQLADVERLETALAALGGASLLERPVRLVQQFDADYARATLDEFEPVLPLTPEGAVYLAAGLLIGFLLVRVAGGALVRLGRR